MKATGIVRRIDDLGRVVIPKEIRRTMRIREGEPLEIFTDRDGEVIFKKYSPMGELGNLAAELAEALSKTAGLSCVICDRDAVIAAAGGARRELAEKRVSEELEDMMQSRHVEAHYSRADGVRITAQDPYYVVTAALIVAEGDVTGCVVFVSEDEVLPDETLPKLAQTAASFLAKHVTM